MTTNAEDFAAALEAARVTSGLSFKRLERLLWARLGEYAPTYETLRRIHRGEVDPEKVDMVILLAIASVYRTPASGLSPIVAQRLNEMRDLVNESRWMFNYANQDELPGLNPAAA